MTKASVQLTMKKKVKKKNTIFQQMTTHQKCIAKSRWKLWPKIPS